MEIHPPIDGHPVARQEKQHMDLQVNRTDLHRTRVVDITPAPLDEGQARLRIESFALTANNITYAVIGDMLQYWDFFPAEDPWGRVPVWGFAEVVESRHDDVATGTRVYGFLPMSEELVITVGRVDDGGFVDGSAHRAPMAGAYNRYTYAEPGVAPGSVGEDRRMVLYPLFFTSFLVDDFLADNGDFGADHVVISSASSKTALGVAHQASRRDGISVVGLTSAANVAFVEGLGVYDQVIPYGDEGRLPDGPAAYVDVTGSAPVRAAVHAHYGDRLRHDMVLGGHPLGGDGRRSDGPAGPHPGVLLRTVPDRQAERRLGPGRAGPEAARVVGPLRGVGRAVGGVPPRHRTGRRGRDLPEAAGQPGRSDRRPHRVHDPVRLSAPRTGPTRRVNSSRCPGGCR